VANAPPVPAGEIDPRFVEDVKNVYASYKPWGRVDDQLRWAPWLCTMPQPGRPAMSAAEGGGHARKLYSLFAKDHQAYVQLHGQGAKPPLVGQAIAKESYVPEIVTKKEPRVPDPDGADHFDPYLLQGDTIYRASKVGGVYVMLRKPPATPGSDDGWIYGTVTPDGNVTSAGRVASCMGCHVNAKHGRLFGADR
jgi:hypothetical protein